MLQTIDESTGSAITIDFHPGTVIIVKGVIFSLACIEIANFDLYSNLSMKIKNNCQMCKQHVQISIEKQKPKYTRCIQETTLVGNYFKSCMFIRGLIAFRF